MHYLGRKKEIYRSLYGNIWSSRYQITHTDSQPRLPELRVLLPWRTGLLRAAWNFYFVAKEIQR